MAEPIVIGNIIIDGTNGPGKRNLKHYTKGQITDWDAKLYNEKVKKLVMEIKNTETGKILINAITKKVTIVPRQILYNANATGGIHYVLSRRRGKYVNRRKARDAYAKGEKIRIQSGLLIGNGLGTKGIVRFTPDQFEENNPLKARKGLELEPNRLLFHELFHAMRVTKGKFTDSSLPTDLKKTYHAKEEYYAILLANTYASEINMPLRGDHGLKFKELKNPKDFMKSETNRRLISSFCQSMPQFSKQIAKITKTQCKFNPIREHYDLLKKYIKELAELIPKIDTGLKSPFTIK